jgi:spore coat protein E
MPSTDKDLQCREIITKAVCGKGRKFSQKTHTVMLKENASNILGCWIINHTYHAEKVGDAVEVAGSYDVQTWVSLNDNTDTKIVKEKVSFHESVPLAFFDANSRGELEVYSHATQEPSCVEARISSNGDSIEVKVESEFEVEVIGETKLCVVTCDDCDIEDFDDLDADSLIDDLD